MGGVRAAWVLIAAATPWLGCDMVASQALDEPRVLAIRVEPPALVAGGEHTLTALLYEVSDPIRWSACPSAWTATDPPACPGDGAIALGTGNPLEIVAPEGFDALWLRVDAPGALTAVKRVAADGPARNPEIAAIATPDGELPTTVRAGDVVPLRARLGDGVVPDQVVISWYTTGGEISPSRTLGGATAELTAPSEPQVTRLIAVCRDTLGGTSWAEATVEVTR